MQLGFKIAAVALMAMAVAGTSAAAPLAEGAPPTGLHRAFLGSTAAGRIDAGAAPRWDSLVRRMADEAPVPAAACKGAQKTRGGDCRLATWERRLGKLSTASPLQQLRAVNRSVNALTYVSDTTNWGQADYWETPREMFARGGDCEGFALTKYFSLRRIGFAETDLRIAIVWDAVDREQHAILLARTDAGYVVLDNKTAEMAPMAATADRYQLLYYLDDGRVALPVAPAAAAHERPRSRIINGGRTLVMQVTPRRARAATVLISPAPAPMPELAPTPFQMAMVETAAPAGR